MQVSYSRIFKKMFQKLHCAQQDAFEERLCLFTENAHHPLLRNHSLSGEWAQCKSINITGDIRAVYEELSDDHVEFIAIGTHSMLYG